METQCLADAHGNVVVVSTRDCSLQRRHQKLVEEAPAPFLTDAQQKQLYDASKAILREAGYVGAGTVADGPLYAVVNVRALDEAKRFTQAPAPMVYDAETPGERLARRTRVWSPARIDVVGG